MNRQYWWIKVGTKLATLRNDEGKLQVALRARAKNEWKTATDKREYRHEPCSYTVFILINHPASHPNVFDAIHDPAQGDSVSIQSFPTRRPPRVRTDQVKPTNFLSLGLRVS